MMAPTSSKVGRPRLPPSSDPRLEKQRAHARNWYYRSLEKASDSLNRELELERAKQLTTAKLYLSVPCNKCGTRARYVGNKTCVHCRKQNTAMTEEMRKTQRRLLATSPEGKRRSKESYANNWALRLLDGARERSKERGHDKPTITTRWIRDQFVKQQGRCFYLGRQLKVPSKEERVLGGLPWQPSLDRIDNTVGYTEENTRLTSWFWNSARGTSSIDRALAWCSETLDAA
jgi:ribosomal protein L44E